MIVRLSRLMRQLRRKKSIGLGVLFVVLIGSVIGNALTFFIFDSAQDPSVGDAFWYSVISITTIGWVCAVASAAAPAVNVATMPANSSARGDMKGTPCGHRRPLQ